MSVYSVTKPCEVCGDLFTPSQTAGLPQKYCGSRCKQKAFHRRWPQRARANGIKFRVAHPDYVRAKWLERYTISQSEYEDMFAQQDGVCAICGREETARHSSGTVRSLCVDHDHATGAIRGLLCRECNRGLGAFGDKADLLQEAAAYLRRSVH